MTMGTAFANDQDNEYKLAELIRIVSEKVDNSKVVSLIDKSLLWAGNHDNESISICGFFILSSLLKAQGNLMAKNKINSIAEVCSQVLQRQVNNL